MKNISYLQGIKFQDCFNRLMSEHSGIEEHILGGDLETTMTLLVR